MSDRTESELLQISRAHNTILTDEIERMKREWIDPQRIVELARNYTDQDKAGWVSISFFDHDPTFGPQWQIMLPGLKHSDHRTMAEAITEAES